jgi:hypothetical protein
MNILSPQALFTRDVPTGNLLWVDQVNGNDSLAVRGQMTVPFKTLSKARDAAGATVALTEQAVTIMVLPGTYDENDLLRNQVNWYFFPGAVVDYSGTGNIFDSLDDTVAAFVGGCGEFMHSGATGAVVRIRATASDSKVTLQARRIQASTMAILIAASGCDVHVEILEDITASGIINVAGVGANAVLRADRLDNTGGTQYAINVGGGCLDVSAHSIESTLPAVVLYGGVGDVVIRAQEILATSDSAVSYRATSSFPTLTIVGARIKSEAAWAVEIQSDIGSNVVIKLAHCLLLNSEDKSIYAPQATEAKIQLSGPCSANAPEDDNVTFVGEPIWYVNPALT